MITKTYNHGVAWEEDSGISQGYSVNGTIYISGQLSHDMQSNFVGVTSLAFPEQLIEISAIAHMD